MAPCIMPAGETWKAPEGNSASDDCGEAVSDWMKKAEAAVKGVPSREGGPSGEEQWEDYQRRSMQLLALPNLGPKDACEAHRRATTFNLTGSSTWEKVRVCLWKVCSGQIQHPTFMNQTFLNLFSE